MYTFEKALEESNYRVILNNQTEKLKEIFIGKTLYSYNGGIFKIDSMLFFEVKLYLEENKNKAVLIDMNFTPIEIENLDEFYKKIRQIYISAIRSYNSSYKRLHISRNVETIVQLHDILDDVEE